MPWVQPMPSQQSVRFSRTLVRCCLLSWVMTGKVRLMSSEISLNLLLVASSLLVGFQVKGCTSSETVGSYSATFQAALLSLVSNACSPAYNLCSSSSRMHSWMGSNPFSIILISSALTNLLKSSNFPLFLTSPIFCINLCCNDLLESDTCKFPHAPQPIYTLQCLPHQIQNLLQANPSQPFPTQANSCKSSPMIIILLFVLLILQKMQENQSSLLTQSLLQEQRDFVQEKITFLSIFRYADRTEKMYMAVGTFTSILAGLTFPFFLMFFGQITDLFQDKPRAVDKGFDVFTKFIIIGAGYWSLTFASLYCWSYSGSTQSMKLKKLYYQTLLQQEVAWYDSIDAGKLASKVAKNISTIENAIGEKVGLLISAIFTSSFGIVFAFVHCWQLSLFLVGVLPIIIYSGFLLMRSYGLRAKVNNASYEVASGFAEQAFNAIRTVKCLVGQVFEVSRFAQALKEGNRKAIRYIIFVSLFTAAFSFVQLGIYSLGMWLGKWVLIWNLESHKYSASDIIGTFFCVVSGGSAFGQISPILKNLAQGKESFKDLMNLVNRRKTLDQFKGRKKIRNIKKITLKNVSFAYKSTNDDQLDKKSILKKITLSFLPNKVNAIVGESGSGKSTIIQLMMRYYDCNNGHVMINKTNIRDINIQNLRRKIGYVGQQPVLFAMSIQDNLKLANSKLTEDEIVECLKKANAWDFVQKMEKGIKTFVGAGGTQLSGGQKQRIAIARALCKHPQLLILDEATSALDRKNEKEIQETLQKLSESNITTVVIAHRLSTIRNAHRIFVLDKGELLQKGTHDNLINRNGVYSRLVHTQLQAEQKQLIPEDNHDSELMKSEDSDSESAATSIQEKLKRKQSKAKVLNIKQGAVFRKLLAQCKPHLSFLVTGALCSLINGGVIPLFTIAFGNILGLLTDVVANQDQIDRFCIYFLLIAIVGSSTVFLYNFCFGVVGDRLVYDLRIKIFEKLLKMPIRYFDKKENTPGAISTKLSNEAYQIHNMITGIIAVVCLNSTTIAVSLVIAAVHCWKIALVTLAFTPLLMIATSIHVSITKSMASKSQRSQKFIGSLISDTVSNIRTVKSFGRSTYFIQKFQESLQELNKIAFQRSLKISFLQGLRRGSIVIVEGFIFWIIGAMYTNEIVTDDKGAIFVAIFAIIYSANTIGQSSQHLPDIARAKRSGAVLFDIIQAKDQEQISLENGGTVKQDLKGSIQFRNISFKYPERDNSVLEQFDLRINQGQKIGLVGQSGSGKSTVLQLLMRLYEPNSGEIFIDGRNIKQFQLYHLRRQIGIVSQQPTMFRGTVLQNLKYNLDLTSEQLQEVVQLSCSGRFIEQWEEGLQKEVGQKGSQISGGQKQRLAIARCLARNPRLLMFDESTSALDAQTQASVFSNLQPILKTITSISIAHRLSTIKDASRIIMMRDGRIIETGSYEELIQMKGSFYRLAQGK